MRSGWLGPYYFIRILLTVSGSRRSYYVLPMVPFAILFTSDWILSAHRRPQLDAYGRWLYRSHIFITFSCGRCIACLYYAQVGVNNFAAELKDTANQIKPWILASGDVDGESKLGFYLQLPPNTKNYHIPVECVISKRTVTLAYAWPLLLKKPDNTIFITRKSIRSHAAPVFFWLSNGRNVAT